MLWFTYLRWHLHVIYCIYVVYVFVFFVFCRNACYDEPRLSKLSDDNKNLWERHSFVALLRGRSGYAIFDDRLSCVFLSALEMIDILVPHLALEFTHLVNSVYTVGWNYYRSQNCSTHSIIHLNCNLSLAITKHIVFYHFVFWNIVISTYTSVQNQNKVTREGIFPVHLHYISCLAKSIANNSSWILLKHHLIKANIYLFLHAHDSALSFSGALICCCQRVEDTNFLIKVREPFSSTLVSK